jgi:hypothetical protein
MSVLLRRLSALGRKRQLAAAAALALALATALLVASGGGQQAAAAGDPVIAAAGDIACDPTSPSFNGGNGQNGLCLQNATYTLITQINPTAVLPLGDTQYYCGGLQAFQRSYALSWGNLNSKSHPVVGNHEYLTSGGTNCDTTGGANGYFSYFGGLAGTRGQGWYSFDLGSWHLIALNSSCNGAGGCSAVSPEGKWLAADLAAHKNQCLLAYWHIPLNSSGGFTATNSYPFWQQLYAAGADVILNGHAHIYERFAPQAPPPASGTNQGVSDPTRGIREFIVGTGGSNHTPLGSRAPNSQVANDATFGVLKLTLHSGSYDWAFVPIAGQSFADSGSQACHNVGGGGGGGGGATPKFVQQKVAGGSGTALGVSLPATGAGHALVAVVAIAAGSSAFVNSVTDSAGGSWTKGPVGFLTGTNTRVEIWYRTGAPSVTSATVNLNVAKSAAVNVSEWSGVAAASALDGSAGGSGSSSTTVSTPTLTTTNATDLVIGGVDYPATATSSLAAPFSALSDFFFSTSVHGRAAYLVTSAKGSFKATWTLSAASGGNGGAILALKAG